MARITRVLILLLLISGCSRETGPALLPDPVPDQEMAPSKSGALLEILDVRTDDGQYKISYELTNQSEDLLGYGGYAALEKKTAKGWHGLIYSDAVFYRDPEFRDFGKMLNPGGSDRMVLDTVDIGTALNPGTYRLVKTVNSKDGQEISVAAEFEVK
ncbi:immunoglobulin-like domain-containing protein [Bhargavaea ginsengi]|uniref:immunoglobulin-like domain-containing protein n=1 Tax=Bhargavaea ginsengi TaxID=426757 RepID=UPI003C766658